MLKEILNINEEVDAGAGAGAPDTGGTSTGNISRRGAFLRVPIRQRKKKKDEVDIKKEKTES